MSQINEPCVDASTTPIYSVDSSSRKSTIKKAFAGLLASVSLIGSQPRKVAADSTCPYQCQALYNWLCYWQWIISIDSEPGCAGGGDVWAFEDSDGEEEGDIYGYVQIGGLIAGCMTYDSSSCDAATC